MMMIDVNDDVLDYFCFKNLKLKNFFKDFFAIKNTKNQSPPTPLFSLLLLQLKQNTTVDTRHYDTGTILIKTLSAQHSQRHNNSLQFFLSLARHVSTRDTFLFFYFQ
jgi:hypothetical protein